MLSIFETERHERLMWYLLKSSAPGTVDVIFCSGLQLVDKVELRAGMFVRQNVRTLPLQDANLCCYIHKVQPMQKALGCLRAWITGIRREQTPNRAHAQILELQDETLLKVNPLLNWTKRDIQDYLKEHKLPAHPLYERGFRSVGCAPCTVSVGPGDDDRAGRWAGRGKTECGLHTELFKHKDLAEVQDQFILKPENPK